MRNGLTPESAYYIFMYYRVVPELDIMYIISKGTDHNI